MPLKIKILKILPYWLIFLTLVTAAQSGAALIPANPEAVPLPPIAMPQVLGASTVNHSPIRGQDSADENLISQINTPDLSEISAKSFLVFNLAGGQNLLQKNPDQKLSIASLTKLMTGLVAYQNIDLNQNITISSQDILNIKPDLNFSVGDNVKALDVFNAMLIGSCNDAALGLGGYVATASGKNFVALMNEQAAALGMANSRFANPMGFDNPDNYSTANDIKTLITATQQLAVFKDLGRRTSYSFTGTSGRIYSTIATNTLIKEYPDLEAIKTGLTEQAGQAMATKLTINGHEIVILVLDSENREGDTLKLRDVMLNDFNWH